MGTHILEQIYAPKNFYERVKNFLREYNPGAVKGHFELAELNAFFKSVYLLGIKGSERLYYWKLVFWTLFKYPRKIQLAITFAIYGYHFRKVAGMVQGQATG